VFTFNNYSSKNTFAAKVGFSGISKAESLFITNTPLRPVVGPNRSSTGLRYVALQFSFAFRRRQEHILHAIFSLLLVPMVLSFTNY
jgi:hypothetical protein